MNHSQRNLPGTKQPGFTLLELMVTVTIVAILASIAVPSYNFAIAKSDRSRAISDINEIALVQGRYFSANRVYTDDYKNLNMSGSTTDSLAEQDGKYNYVISIQNGGANYTVVANPTLSRDIWDLSLDDRGIKTSKKETDPDTAWVTGWP